MVLDGSLVQELRHAASHGATPSKLILLVGDRLGVQNTNFRLLAAAYFREAFYLSLPEAATIGALSIFPGGALSEGDLDREMTPIIERTRHLWE